MAETHFYGASALTLDGKGRLAVPTRHRDVLVATGDTTLYVTKHPDRALLLFPRSAWEPFARRLEAEIKGDGRDWRRIFLGWRSEVEIDGSSRILIPPELRAFAGLTRDVLLLGMGTNFEIWDAAAYHEREARAMQEPMPESVKELSI